jgi:hypothetical protein
MSESGASDAEVARALGVSWSTAGLWRREGWRAPLLRDTCFRCDERACQPPGPAAYAHLLGLYLGDGCISDLRRGVQVLRIACCDDYPRLIDECEAAMRAVRPGAVSRFQAPGCQYVVGYWKHWSCVFPQHGPGRKHDRAIALEPWQQVIVDEHPGRLLRGLFHSDGCRVQNWATAKNGQRYEGYPRYLFSNASADIIGICCAALDRLGAAHTHPRRDTVSVARKASVALLDEHVGPKS